MPTGYTAAIPDGITFKTFAMNCARAFGACITLRDEPGGGESIPEEFQPSDYHQKAIEKARVDLAALASMPAEALERAASKAWDDAETRRTARLAEIQSTLAAYEAMLAKVEAWAAPTADHDELKKFMRDQIKQSIDFDCSTRYYETPTVRLTGEQWATERLVALHRDVAYHEKAHAEETERAASRTAWVKALRDSL